MEISDRYWLTVGEAAELATVSRWTLYQAAERGELRHVRIGGRRAIRLSRDALDAWLRRYERVPLATEVRAPSGPRPPASRNKASQAGGGDD